MTTSSLTPSVHLELLSGGRPSRRAVAGTHVARPAPASRDVGIMDAFGARRPLGVAPSQAERVGVLVMVCGLALVVVSALL